MNHDDALDAKGHTVLPAPVKSTEQLIDELLASGSAIPMGISKKLPDDVAEILAANRLIAAGMLSNPPVLSPPIGIGKSMNTSGSQAAMASVRRTGVHIYIDEVSNGFVIRSEHSNGKIDDIAVAKTLGEVHEEVTRAITTARLDRSEG